MWERGGYWSGSLRPTNFGSVWIWIRNSGFYRGKVEKILTTSTTLMHYRLEKLVIFQAAINNNSCHPVSLILMTILTAFYSSYSVSLSTYLGCKRSCKLRFICTGPLIKYSSYYTGDIYSIDNLFCHPRDEKSIKKRKGGILQLVVELLFTSAETAEVNLD